MLRGEIPADAPGDPRCGVLNGIPRQASVPRGRLHLRVTEQLPDHGEALAQGQRPRSIRVAKVMNSHVLQHGAGFGPERHDPRAEFSPTSHRNQGTVIAGKCAIRNHSPWIPFKLPPHLEVAFSTTQKKRLPPNERKPPPRMILPSC